MNTMRHFPALILNARPGSGKSEVLHYLESISPEERLKRFHIGPMLVLDDFPMLWAWFEEDDLLERVFGRDRLHSDSDGYFLYEDLWHLLIRRLSLEYEKNRRDLGPEPTILIEFSRGTEHGGYQKAYQHLSEQVLRDAAVLYLHVSYAESLRKNRQRFNPDRPDSILEHGLSDEKLERLYKEDDWKDFTSRDAEWIHVRNRMIPYVVFENEDDVTTPGGEPLGERLEDTLNSLWKLWLRRQAV